ncbi:hypothetical protein GCM10027185_24520 [Spirosoma pulveris]
MMQRNGANGGRCIDGKNEWHRINGKQEQSKVYHTDFQALIFVVFGIESSVDKTAIYVTLYHELYLIEI